MIWIELSAWVLSWLIGSVAFAGYERHVPWSKRLLKLVVILGTLTLVYLLLGRIWFYGIIAATASTGEPRSRGRSTSP